MPCSFAEDVAALAEASCPAMEVWLTKLENHLQRYSLTETRKLLADRNVTLAAAAYQGGLLLSQGEQRQAHYEHFRKRLELCQQLAIPTLLVVADFVEQIDQTMLERAVVSLAQAAQWAAGFGVRLALEFRASSTFCTSLDTALALIAQCGESNVGVCLDVFHFYSGPSKFEDLELLTPENLAHVQVCDLAGVARELATDSDRILPGDGDLHLQPIFEQLRDIGYGGWVSLEVLSPTLWQANATQVVGVGMMAMQNLLDKVGAGN
jgi:4-hydroxyphenylpyruvate dioxygenase